MGKNARIKNRNLEANSGQSLAEIIIGVTIGAVLIGAGVAAIAPILKSNLETKNVQIASPLIQEYLEITQNLAESDWFNIYNPPAAKGESSQFYLVSTSTTYQLVAGATSTVIEDKTFTRHLSIENVNRDLCGAGDITTDSVTSCSSGPGTYGVTDDPSTQKITVTVTWGGSASVSRNQYLVRGHNKSFIQTDWSGGSDQEGPISQENDKFSTSTGIDYSTSTGSIRIQGI